MEEKIDKVKKGVKGDRKFLFLVFNMMVVFALINLTDIVQYYMKSADSFEVKMDENGNIPGDYSLFIDGEIRNSVDYNEYFKSVDESGNTNVKMCFIIQEVGKLIRTIIMSIIFYFAFLILDNVFQPFSKNNIRRLRIMAVLTMLLSVIPASIMIILKMIVFNNLIIIFTFSQFNFFIIMMGVLLGVISELFKYGHVLQGEMDQIA